MKKSNVYIGAYTRKESFANGIAQGISHFQFDPLSRRMGLISTVPAGDNPTFLALSPDRNFLYAVNEVTQGSGTNGWVSAFAIDPSKGNLSYLNRQSTQGFSPCHLCITDDGRFVIAANYESGNICLMPRAPDGRLEPVCDLVQFFGNGPHPRQEGPHAHMVTPTLDGNFILAVDLGSDQIWVFRLDEKHGKLLLSNPPTIKLPPGSGPRHIAFHPNGRFGYVLGELDSTVTLLHYEAGQGDFLLIETLSTLPDDFHGQNTGAEIQVAPSGKFLYASNRGHDSLVVFRVDPVNGRLELLGHESTQGTSPRHFIIDPSGKTLIAANQDSDTLTVFKIHPYSGGLTLETPLVHSETPVCILFA